MTPSYPRAACFHLFALLAVGAFAEAPGEVDERQEAATTATKEEDEEPREYPPSDDGRGALVAAGAQALAADEPSQAPAVVPRELRPAGLPSEFRGPDVTVIAGEERMVHEYRQNGQLRMIKVVPKRGKPYYLVPRDGTRGWGDLEQADALLPKWVLWEF